MGGQNGRKIEILTVFGNMLFETLILVEFCLSFLIKSKANKNAVFLVVFCVILGVFLTLETFKIVLPSRRELNFYKIAFFALEENRRRNWIEKGMDFDLNLGLETC